MPKFSPAPAKPVVQEAQGVAADGTALHAVYLEQSAVNAAVALIFPDDRLPRIVHWGRTLPAAGRGEWLPNLYDATKPQRVSGALDETSWPSILPTQSESWTGAPRFSVSRNGVELFCRFTVTMIKAEVVASDTASVTVSAEDADQGVGLRWVCELLPSGLVRQRAEVRNLSNLAGPGRPSGLSNPAAASTDALAVNIVELGFPVPAVATEILTTTGHHLRERSPQRQPLTIGRFAKVSMVGRPDFDASLLLAAGVPGFGFEHGETYAVHTAWSGNSVLSAERTPYTSGLIGGGETLFGGEVTLRRDDVYCTPWVYGSFGDGLNAVAARFHAYLRGRHPELSAKPRPVILNTWEAVYFNHDFDTLAALADKAAEVGVERFVVDDGWFGSRRDDTSGLGDWRISPDVWPDGPKSLKALADYVHGKGMEFGLWFEPEMVNPDSDVARAHPDWILAAVPGAGAGEAAQPGGAGLPARRLPMQGRSQQTLDLTNPEAWRYVFDSIDGLIDELGIDYIKWDHNRLVTEAVSPYSGRPAVHAQTDAVYEMWQELKDNHPGLELESCSSGGGRVDLGILEYADRIWASDCVDPVERVDIQRYTSLLVPPEMIGEHVGASPAHSTHRPTSQRMRMATAFFGHLGVEWNLLREPQEAVDELAEWIAEFKKHREWFAIDTLVHADTGDPAVRLDGVVKPDRSAAIYRFTQLTTSATYPAAPVHLPGLKPESTYLIQPVPVNVSLGGGWNSAAGGGELESAANGQTPLGWWNADGIRLPGAVLESTGLRMPSLNPANAVLFWAIEV
ncbi:alpha-galactosidase [Bifidobacterium simiarum]|uniref:alpha-galactosidase n=1 Tax=Bifidobacterium simiarum TaxID=2045441 RepID=UPI001BDD6EA8|nr:alpha-galactosidase [Bifidobacterium simiarum]MBT1167061.1 alpha-galactosidase [Bifidobacterium simiarum]